MNKDLRKAVISLHPQSKFADTCRAASVFPAGQSKNVVPCCGYPRLLFPVIDSLKPEMTSPWHPV